VLVFPCTSHSSSVCLVMHCDGTTTRIADLASEGRHRCVVGRRRRARVHSAAIQYQDLKRRPFSLGLDHGWCVYSKTRRTLPPLAPLLKQPKRQFLCSHTKNMQTVFTSCLRCSHHFTGVHHFSGVHIVSSSTLPSTHARAAQSALRTLGGVRANSWHPFLWEMMSFRGSSETT
jgi:hypothetical protein